MQHYSTRNECTICFKTVFHAGGVTKQYICSNFIRFQRQTEVQLQSSPWGTNEFISLTNRELETGH